MRLRTSNNTSLYLFRDGRGCILHLWGGMAKNEKEVIASSNFSNIKEYVEVNGIKLPPTIYRGF